MCPEDGVLESGKTDTDRWGIDPAGTVPEDIAPADTGPQDTGRQDTDRLGTDRLGTDLADKEMDRGTETELARRKRPRRPAGRVEGLEPQGTPYGSLYGTC